ncbi:MAG: mitochondrial fission ELM1 family protein [Proteobacteria bacterium]|nr:mitochondrial fission ELM1 family protein [Pseudomonadota bacterium]
MSPISCWILTEGHAGMEAQCRGLAAALDLTPVVKRVRVRALWDILPNRLWFCPLAAPRRDSDPLQPPWPELLITCGNVSAGLSLGIRRASQGRTRTVHIQDPRLDPRRFDLVLAPRHDGLTGPNVMVTRAAIHPVTPARLAEGARAWAGRLAHLPRPLVAVLIGGSNRRHRLTPAIMTRLADQLAALARRHGAGLAVTPSRRTGSENEAILRQRLAGLPAYIWDGTGDNPYFGILGLADAIVVTEDSVSMTTEACATGKPVYVAQLEGRSRRLGAFHDGLVADGITRPFTGALETWRYTPPDDTARAAAEIRRRFGWDGGPAAGV